MNQNELEALAYNTLIPSLDEDVAQILAGRLGEAFRDAAVKDTVTTARREQTRKAFDEIAGDLIDMDTYMKNIDLHIQWLGAALPAESVDIPEFKAAVDTLNRISARIAAVGIVLSTE